MFDRADKNALGNIPIVRATRSSCVVCGHPTSDCKGESEPPDHIVGMGRAKEEQDLIYVREDVYVESRVTDRFTTKVKVAAEGQYIPRRLAQEYGLL